MLDVGSLVRRLRLQFSPAVCSGAPADYLKKAEAACATGYLAFMDLSLALLPVTIIWNLQMTVKKKAGLGLILGLGVL